MKMDREAAERIEAATRALAALTRRVDELERENAMLRSCTVRCTYDYAEKRPIGVYFRLTAATVRYSDPITLAGEIGREAVREARKLLGVDPDALDCIDDKSEEDT